MIDAGSEPTDPALLDMLADRGWPALERDTWHDWRFRFSGGVTDRANSVLPAGRVPEVAAAVDAAEAAYASRGLRTRFQGSRAVDGAVIAELRRRGYEEHSATRILVADAEVVAGSRLRGDERVRIEPHAGDNWMDAWWSVDGRGGAAERQLARRILTGVPALYASVAAPDARGAAPGAEDQDSARVLSVGRLALVDDWGGLFAVATRPEARGRGHAGRLVVALAAEARDRGVRRLWLQVLDANVPAIRLYRRLGFVDASSYSYWSAPLR